MKNLNIHVSQNYLFETTFSISRSNKSYAFFQSEYKSLPYDSEGNIILRFEDKKEVSVINKVINSIKEFVLRNDNSIGISPSSQEYAFFCSEYQNHFSEDLNHNMIIPQDEYPKIKTLYLMLFQI